MGRNCRWMLVPLLGAAFAFFAVLAPTGLFGQAAVSDEPAIAELPEGAVDGMTAVRPMTTPALSKPAAAMVSSTSPEAARNVERVLLFSPRGPIVVQATIFADGQPYRMRREALVDQILAQADTDGDGKPTWDEALRNPRFAIARFGAIRQSMSDQQRLNIIRQYDLVSNGVVDRNEASALINQIAGGPVFQVVSGQAPLGSPEMRPLFDADKDGAISPEEMTAASERLKSLDANGNDLIEASEVGSARFGGRPILPNRGNNPALYQSGVLLGPSANFPALFEGLKSRYAREGKLVAASFPLWPNLMESLDTDANGELDARELEGLNRIRPHVALAVHLGTVEAGKPGVEVIWSASGLSREETNASAPLELHARGAGFRIRIAESGRPQASYDYSRSAKTMIDQYDIDKNGYLDKAEVEKSPNKQYLLSQFDRWDDNGDGMVFAEEIEADFQRQMAPQLSQVYLVVGDHGPSLFSVLDQSGDGRLSLREMRIAGERLGSLDRNGDGKLDADEIPGELRLQFNRGGAAYGGGFGQVGRVMQPGNAPPSAMAGPKWFVHMDRNGDGDISPREFLGTPEQFEKLDRNHDGFIEPAEAKNAETSASNPLSGTTPPGVNP